MKKMLIAAALICAATLSHAAALNWKLTNIESSPDVTATAGWMAYWMDASTYDAFSALDADKVAAYVTSNADYSKAMTVRNGVGTVNSTNGSWSYVEGAPETVAGYMVIFNNATAADATHYAFTEKVSTTVPAAGNMSVAVNFANSSGWQAVPEPTSGLLMIVGLAGLALRRRRA